MHVILHFTLTTQLMSSDTAMHSDQQYIQYAAADIRIVVVQVSGRAAVSHAEQTCTCVAVLCHNTMQRLLELQGTDVH